MPIPHLPRKVWKHQIARGLVNYSSDQLRRILGCHSSRIAEILGCCEHEEAVHRDNLALR